MRKFFVATAAVVALSLGALGIAALNPFSGAGASAPATTVTTTPARPVAAAARPGAGIVQSVLADLVSKGTITQAQSDAITAALQAKVESLKAQHPGAKRVAARRKLLVGTVVVSAKAIGIAPKALVADLKSGQSIAEVATAKGVTPAIVVAALVKAGTTRIDTAATNGKITAAQATKLKARLLAAATRAVDAKRK